MAITYNTSPAEFLTTNGIETQIPSVTFNWGSSTPASFGDPLPNQSADVSDFSYPKSVIDGLVINQRWTYKTFANGSRIDFVKTSSSEYSIYLVDSTGVQPTGQGYAGGIGLNNTIVFFSDYPAIGVKIQNAGGYWYYYRLATGTYVTNYLNGAALTEDPYQTSPESVPDGGYGDFNYKSDTIALPTAPTISVSDSGFITLYKPTLAQLQSLSAYLWSGLFDIATFRKIFADPMDCIISLALIPVDPTTSVSQELKVGNVGTGITINKLPTQFVEVTFNSLNIGRRANSFMDYSPYTKIQIYLPFIGTRSLSIDDIAGKNVTLKYIIDIFTGACNASIGVEVEDRDGTQKTTCLYQFTGNVLANVPVTASNFASFLQATVGAVSTAVGVATGAGALAGVASAINAAQSMKPDIEKSGNLSSTAGFLGVQKPYLILTYPNLCRPQGRDKVTGTPSFIGLGSNKKLSAFHGFTQLHRINVQGITCTEAERQMILSQLTGEGVILP